MNTNETWNYEAKVQVTVKGLHDPSFYNYIMERYEGMLKPIPTDNDLITSTGVSNTETTPFIYPIYIFIALLQIVHRLKKSRNRNLGG